MSVRVLALLLVSTGSVGAATYQVGPGRPYADLPQLFDLVNLEPGDVVEVDGGTPTPYAGGIVMPAGDSGAPGNPVILRGISVGGARPHLRGGGNTIEFRSSNHVVFENFEVSGTGDTLSGTFRCVYHHAHDIVLRNVYIHDCPRHGVLGADQDSGSLTIEHSEIFNAGSNVGNHAIYMATDEVAYPGAVFRLQSSYIHDSQFDPNREGGNLIKSRAERNEIYGNWLEGAYFHELELIGPDPAGAPPGWSDDLAREDSDVVGNVIVHTASFGSIIRLGGDATSGGRGESFGRYRFAYNTILRFGGSDVPTVFRLFEGIESLDAHDNVLWREGANGVRVIRESEAQWVFGSRIAGSGNVVDTGSSFLPGTWLATTLSADPGFANATLASLDPRPVEGSVLLGLASAIVSSGPDYALANPRAHPPRHPPIRTVQIPAPPRPDDGDPDVGAYEREDPGAIFSDGFEG